MASVSSSVHGVYRENCRGSHRLRTSAGGAGCLALSARPVLGQLVSQLLLLQHFGEQRGVMNFGLAYQALDLGQLLFNGIARRTV